MATRRRRALLATLALAGSTLVALLLGEAAVRLLQLQGDQLFHPDRHVGWVHRSSFEGLYVSPQVTNRVRFDSRGLVGPERSLAKPPGSIRVLAVGDSFTESLQVPDSLGWVGVADRALGDGAAVWNAGVSGYGTDSVVLYLRRFGAALDPDVVFLLFFTGNDVSDNDATLNQVLGNGLPKPSFVLDDTGRLVLHDHPLPAPPTRPWTGVKNWLRDHSRLYLLVRDSIAEIRVRRARGAASDGIPRHWGVFQWPPDADFRRAWRVTEALLALLDTEVDALGADLAVGILPSGWRIDPDLAREAVATHPAVSDTATWKPDRVDAGVRRICEDLDIPVVDLTPVLRARRAVSDEDFYGDHLTPIAHEVVGRAVAAFLQEEGLAASPP